MNEFNNDMDLINLSILHMSGADLERIAKKALGSEVRAVIRSKAESGCDVPEVLSSVCEKLQSHIEDSDMSLKLCKLIVDNTGIDPRGKKSIVFTSVNKVSEITRMANHLIAANEGRRRR